MDGMALAIKGNTHPQNTRQNYAVLLRIPDFILKKYEYLIFFLSKKLIYEKLPLMPFCVVAKERMDLYHGGPLG